MVARIKDLLTDLLTQNSDNWRIKVLQQWKELVGDLHTRMRLEKISDNTLIVGVYDSHWMHELYMLSPLIMRTINASLEQPYIKRIQFKLARKKDELVRKKVIKRPFKQDKMPIFTHQEQRALNNMPDGELREALAAFLVRCYQERL